MFKPDCQTNHTRTLQKMKDDKACPLGKLLSVKARNNGLSGLCLPKNAFKTHNNKVLVTANTPHLLHLFCDVYKEATLS